MHFLVLLQVNCEHQLGIEGQGTRHIQGIICVENNMECHFKPADGTGFDGVLLLVVDLGELIFDKELTVKGLDFQISCIIAS